MANLRHRYYLKDFICGIITGINRTYFKTTLTQLERLEAEAMTLQVLLSFRRQIAAVKQLAKQKNLLSVPYPMQPLQLHTTLGYYGTPSEANAHPHILDNKYAIIHNGIIENYADLKKKYKIDTLSETDSEIIVHLYKHFLTVTDSQEAAWESTVLELEGSWATVLLDTNQPDSF